MNISIVVSIISIAFCLLFFFYFKWYIKKRTSASELLAEYRSEIYRLQVDINGVTERNLSLVEDNIKKLKELLEETDKRIKVYNKELERSKTGEALYTSLGRGIRAALNTEPPAQNTLPPAPELSNVHPQKYAVPAFPNPEQQTSPPASSLPPSPPPSQTPNPVIDQPKPSKMLIRTQIDELVKEGAAPSKIAARLGISLAEVDLAMQLIKRGKNK